MKILAIFLALTLPCSAMVAAFVPLMPSNMPGRKLCLDSANVALSGSNVSQWNDTSGNGNNFTQGTMSSQPTYSASVFNGQPALVFTSSEAMSGIATSIPQPFTIFLIFQPTAGSAGPNYANVFGTFGSTVLYLAEPDTSNYKVYSGYNYVDTGVAWSNATALIGLYVNGASTSVSLNGSAFAVLSTPGTNPLVASSTQIGGGLAMNVAGVFVITGNFSGPQFNQFHYYARRRWGTL